MSLSQEERAVLLQLVRESIESVARGHDTPRVDTDAVPDALQRPGASFVTLNKAGNLRGCVGSLEARRPLVLDVQQNGLGAAFRDPRFAPVRLEELPDLQIEISVLSEPRELAYSSTQELLDSIRPGVDGVVIEKDWHRATFLPQVWDKLPDKDPFMERLCLKAGLRLDAYRRGDLDVFTYQVEKFTE